VRLCHLAQARVVATTVVQTDLEDRLAAAREDLFKVDTLVRRLLKAESKFVKANEEVRRSESKLHRVLEEVREEQCRPALPQPPQVSRIDKDLKGT